MNVIAGKTGGQNFQHAPASPNNQLPGYTYDASGNLTVDGTHTYSYDAESRIVTAAGVTYTYDGDGMRVAKSNGRLYWFGMDGQMLTETDATGALIHEFVYLGGQRVGFINSAGNRYYYWSDHLGSANVVTNAQGAIKEESDFYPFGGERVITDLLDNRYKFTGKEHDTESGLDYFGARYYTSNLGRFMTPDWAAKPVAVPYANYGNPQSLNLYSYVENNPTTLGDPDGHQKPDVKGSDDPSAMRGSTSVNYPPEEREKAQNQKRDGGLVYTPRDMPDGGAGILGQLFGKILDFLGITFVTARRGDTLSDDPPVQIPLPKNLLWIDQIVNGHGWDEHGKSSDYGSKEEYKQLILETVQNAQGGEIVRNPEGRKGVTGFWNDKEGFVVWHDKNKPGQGTAFRPDEPDVYKKRWGFE